MYSTENRKLDASSMTLKHKGAESWTHLIESIQTPTVERIIRTKMHMLTVKLAGAKICSSCYGLRQGEAGDSISDSASAWHTMH